MKASIERINWLEGSGNTLAYVDVCIENLMIIKGFKIMQGKNGKFLAPPSVKDADNKYWKQVVFKEATKGDFTNSNAFSEFIIGLAYKKDAPEAAGPASMDEPGQDPTPEPEPPADDRPTHNCKACGAKLVTLKWINGRTTDVDYDKVPPGTVQYDRMTMSPHFEVCPKGGEE